MTEPNLPPPDGPMITRQVTLKLPAEAWGKHNRQPVLSLIVDERRTFDRLALGAIMAGGTVKDMPGTDLLHPWQCAMWTDEQAAMEMVVLGPPRTAEEIALDARDSKDVAA